MWSRVFLNSFSYSCLTTSTGPFLASATLSRPQLTFSGTSSGLSQPLRHLKASVDTLTTSTDTLTASTDTLTASTDTLTASKALSRPLQSTSALWACNREFTGTFSRLWECCWGRESVVYSHSLFRLPYNHYGHSHGLYWHPYGLYWHFMASTTLTRHLQTISRLCSSLKASSGSLTGYTSILTASTALFWPLQTLSCEILPTFLQIYIFTAHIVQKHFLKAMRGFLEAMRVLLEAVRVLLEAVRMFVKSVRAQLKAVRVFAGALVMSKKS